MRPQQSPLGTSHNDIQSPPQEAQAATTNSYFFRLLLVARYCLAVGARGYVERTHPLTTTFGRQTRCTPPLILRTIQTHNRNGSYSPPPRRRLPRPDNHTTKRLPV